MKENKDINELMNIYSSALFGESNKSTNAALSIFFLILGYFILLFRKMKSK